MSLSIVNRPYGFHLGDAVAATITNNFGNSEFNKTSHGLIGGDWVYVYSEISEYNGFWRVNTTTANTFQVTSDESGVYDPPFIVEADITYYPSIYPGDLHYWNCIHLPIVYKLKSDIWPINGTDTARTITTFSNYNGYTYLNLSGDLKSSGNAASLESVILSGTSVDGVYKIIQWIKDTNIVINLPYSAGNVLSSGTCQYYYFNYHARIKIYAGIKSGHTWNSYKPIEEVAEVRCIPDSNGIITLNISEYIKEKIKINSNNTILGTLPNNVDAWCNYYIAYAESYDDSNMYTLSEYVSSYTDDSFFIGFAVNSKLPFKNRYSGAMSEYVSGQTATTLQKWLTVFEEPTMWAGKYFDVSFIKNSDAAGDYINRKMYVNDVLVDENNDTVTNYNQGVYRYAVEQSGFSEDRIDITYYNSSNVQLSETLTINVNQACSNQDFYVTWLNHLGGYDYWNFTARKTFATDILESKTQEKNIFTNWPNSYGEFADSILKQTVRRSRQIITVSSQLLSVEEVDSLSTIYSSLLVQICVSKYDRRTVIIETNTLRTRRDQEKTSKINLTVNYTDELPTQSL